MTAPTGGGSPTGTRTVRTVEDAALWLALALCGVVSCTDRAVSLGGDGPLADLVSVSPPVDGPTRDHMVQPDRGGPVAQCSGGWCTIPAGYFMMGSPTTEPCRDTNEDQHQVTLTRAFELSAHETTQGEFLALMGYNPSSHSGQNCGSSCPVEKVSWHEAAAYCNALSAQKGFAKCYSCSGTGASVSCSEATAYSGSRVYDCPGYRLPTDAEWEYAYRAGTTTAYYSGATDPYACEDCGPPVDVNADKIAWYCANSGETTHPVGQKAPNAWGLYDMAGNVFEWCHDRYQNSLGTSAVTDPWGAVSGSYRVKRGGGFCNHSWYTRAAHRNDHSDVKHDSCRGFRCARTK